MTGSIACQTGQVLLPAVGTVFCVDALIRESQPLNWPAAHQVLFDNGRRILGPNRAVPYRFWIHHHGRPVFALVQTERFVDADAVGKAGGLGQLLQLGVQLAFAVCGARRAGRAGGTDVVANKDMAFKRGQSWNPPLLE
jgi:hypothetical protein